MDSQLINMQNIIISPSILSADFKNLDKDLKELIQYGIKYIHFDVMDGVFVNNISFGIPVLKSLKEGNYPLLFDVHLMIINPLKYVNEFLNSGADIITVHYETLKDNEIKELAEIIHSKNKKIGLSIKPSTIPESIAHLLKYIDLVLVMSVEPGFGGQSFIESSLEKIAYLADYRTKNKLCYMIEVDGGINETTGKECKKHGADILVAGSYIFKNNNRSEAINLLK